MLTIYAANHLDVLASNLAQSWRYPGDGPDTLLVQSTALAAWLRRSLAQAWGVAADLDLLAPHAWLHRLGVEVEPPWRAETLRWRLTGCVPTAELPADDLARHRFLGQLASALESWQLQRPVQLAAWSEGQDLDDWRAVTWRHLMQKAAEQGLVEPRAEHLRGSIDAIRSGALAVPPRVGAFAICDLPLPWLELFRALGEVTECTLWLCSPSPLSWADLPEQCPQIRTRLQALRAPAAVPPAGVSTDPGHPLVARLGGHGRRWMQALSTDELSFAWDVLPTVVPERTCLLSTLQADVAEMQPPAVFSSKSGDRSITFHDCPSERRELEVLREVIAEALDQGVEPSRIRVLMAVPARYAPLVPAVFDRPLVNGQVIPWILLERSLAEGDPVAEALLAVAELIGGRAPRLAIVSLLHRDAVRTALDLGGDVLDAVVGHFDRAGVRWGSDVASRAMFGGCSEGTWSMATDRIVAGWWLGRIEHDLLPVADDLAHSAGPMARTLSWIRRLFDLLKQAETPHAADDWCDWSRHVLDQLLSVSDDRSEATLATRKVLDDIAASWSNRAGVSTSPILTGLVWREVLGKALKEAEHPQPATGIAGGIGGVVFCGLRPLRGVPADVIALVGQGDANIPRRSTAPAWDIAAPPQRSGDRDPQGEDRQLMLEAILAAGGRLHCSWVGRDPRTDQARPASVGIEALRLVIDAMAGQGTAAKLTTVHPRHARGPTRDPLSAQVAVAMASGHCEPRPFLDYPVRSTEPEPKPWSITMTELYRILADPADAYLSQVLQIFTKNRDYAADDDELFSLGRLPAWSLRQDLAGSMLDGQPEIDPRRRSADGTLPYGNLGLAVLRSERLIAEGLAANVNTVRGDPPPDFTDVEVNAIDGSWILRARLAGLRRDQRVWWTATSKPSHRPKRKLQAWLNAVISNCLKPTQCHLIGIKDDIVIPACPTVSVARARLNEIMALAGRCRREPVPMTLAAGIAKASGKSCTDDDEEGSSSSVDDDESSTAADLLWRDREIWTQPGFAQAAEALWGSSLLKPKNPWT